jgi:hypothetical protein
VGAVAETLSASLSAASALAAIHLGATAMPGSSVKETLTPDRLKSPSVATALERASRPGYGAWLEHVKAVGECTHPVRLSGNIHTIDPATGEITATATTHDLPDAAIYKACGNRRAAACPSCAQTYRADTYQLIHAGINGGKNVPESVRSHPFAFVTLTAPSFGLVHSTRALSGRPRPCRPRRTPQVCPHGVELACRARHHEADPVLGRPFCLDCYDHDHQVVFNVLAGELWRRTTATLAKHLKRLDARASFGKVAEMQSRGVVHFHAIIRLDHLEPQLRATPDGGLQEIPAPPPDGVTFDVLAELLTAAVHTTGFDSAPHLDRPEGWPITWGGQLDIRSVQAVTRQEIGTGPIAETAVAGYLAKYATKATEAAGHTSSRLSGDTIEDHTDWETHTGRLIEACWRLGRPGVDLDPDAVVKNNGRMAYHRLRRWAHMLGFGGHFSTKSRRYSTTLAHLRQARIDYRRQATAHRLADELDGDETTLLIGSLTFAGIGWHTTGDALLAATAAAKAREQRRVARDEIACQQGQLNRSSSIAA